MGTPSTPASDRLSACPGGRRGSFPQVLEPLTRIESARPAVPDSSASEGDEMSLLYIILIVVLVLALLGFVGGRGRY
jgi:hypothetical protein